MDVPARKPLAWVGTSLDDLRAFPSDARSAAGYQLDRIQRGQEPSDWKPMTSVGPGVREIRIRSGREHRIFYVARFAEGIYVLHAFEKKSQKTASADLDIGRRRYRLVVEQHRQAESRKDGR